MNKNHISDELLIAWIDKSLSATEYNKVTRHLEDCNECYFRYSTLLESATTGELAKPEEVPNEIKQFAKEQLGLTNTITSNQANKNSIINKLRNIGLKLPILRPIPITALLISVILLLILVKKPNNLLKSTPYIATSEEISPISLAIKNDSLIITQSIKVNSHVSILSLEGDTIFSENFTELKSSFTLDKFKDHENIQIFITSYGTCLLDTTLTIH